MSRMVWSRSLFLLKMTLILGTNANGKLFRSERFMTDEHNPGSRLGISAIFLLRDPALQQMNAPFYGMRKTNTPSNDARFGADWKVTAWMWSREKSQSFSKELIYHSSAMASGGSDFCQIDGAPKRLWRVYQNSLDFPSGRHCKKALVIVSR